VPDQKFVLVGLLFQCLNRAGGNTVRIFASAADQKISGKLRNGDNTVISWMIEIAALYLALLALSRTADIEIDEKPHVGAFHRLYVYISLMKLLCAC